MDLDIVLYRGQEQEYYGEFDLADVLRKAVLRHFGDQARRGQIRIDLDEPHDPDPYPGPPEMRNLGASGWCTVRLLKGGTPIREETLKVSQFLGPVLAEELQDREPQEAAWSFLLVQRHRKLAFLQAALVPLLSLSALARPADERPAPEVKGTIDVDIAERPNRPFTLTPIADTAAGPVSPADLGLDPGHLGQLNILMSAPIRHQLISDMPLSDRIEEGGFLLGRVHLAAPDTHLVEITHVSPAHHSGAGPVHFTFTGESFLTVAQLIAERGRGEELVGWYHTHLFGVEVMTGLSSVDIDLHLATFQRPWQVAALINLLPGARLLRFYGRGGDGLTEYSQWIADDSGRYRAAGSTLGGA